MSTKRKQVNNNYADLKQPVVQTLFTIDNEIYPVEGHGQETISAIMKGFPNNKIVHTGFLVDGKFVEPKLN